VSLSESSSEASEDEPETISDLLEKFMLESKGISGF
jgi:hypothetical protein